MKPIYEALPEGFIDYNRLRIILAIFEYEYGFEGEHIQDINKGKIDDDICVIKDKFGDQHLKRKIPDWMTPQSKDNSNSVSTSSHFYTQSKRPRQGIFK